MTQSFGPTTPTALRHMLAGLGALTLMGAAPALAQVTKDGNIEFSTSLSSLPSNDSVATVYLGTSSTTGFVSNATFTEGSGTEAATVSFTGTAGIYNGTTSGVAAAPYTPTGPQTSNYFAAEPNGTVSINYAASQQYFGILWGSVDTYNTLTFYNGSHEVGQLTGSAITANARGSQGANGSYFVNANFDGVTYNRVVASSSNPAFEFGVIAASQTQQTISPAPFGVPTGTLGGAAVLLVGLVVRARRGLLG